MHLILDPKIIGHPLKRADLRYTWGIRKDHVLRGSLEDVLDVFFKDVRIEGDVFYCAPP